MDERPDNSQQLMDILLVMDQEKKTIQAVSGVKDGELQTKNPLEDNNDLLRVDRHGDMFSNFFSNLWNQLKDPTRFHFFRVPEEDVQRVAADFQQTVQNPTPEGQARMAQYEVQHPRTGTTTGRATGAACRRAAATAADRCTAARAGTATAAVQVRRGKDRLELARQSRHQT